MSEETQVKPSALLVLFLGVLSATPPLSTDMYLSAIPRIAEQWGAPVSQINLSLVLWFVAFSVSLLFFGALSDRVGRRPVMLGGLAGFSLASALCAFATGPITMILFRILQGIAAAAPSAMTMAYCRDCFKGRTRQQMLAWIGIIIAVAPMVAPSIGAVILRVASWRIIFLLLCLVGAVQFMLAVRFFRESTQQLESGGVDAAFRRYFRLSRNRNFVLANFSMCLMAAPMLGYVGIAAPVYMDHYELSETAFALLFAAAPMMSMAGAYTCTRLLRRYSDWQLVTAALIGSVLMGLFVLELGEVAFYFFTIGTAGFAFFAGISRPLSNHIVLEQVEEDIGAASSTIIFSQVMAGALCMAVTTANWSHPISVYAICVLAMPGAVLLLWPLLLRRLRFSS